VVDLAGSGGDYEVWLALSSSSGCGESAAIDVILQSVSMAIVEIIDSKSGNPKTHARFLRDDGPFLRISKYRYLDKCTPDFLMRFNSCRRSVQDIP
jgi:hypothetical protein